MSERLKVILVTLGLVSAITVVALAPKIIHAFDSGEETVTVEKLTAGYKPKTRNLIVEGRLQPEYRVERVVTDKRGRTRSRRTYVPIVPGGWLANDPIHVVYGTKTWITFSLERMAAQPKHKGVLRDVLWEGLPSQVKERFEKLGLKLADDVLLIEE